MIELSEKQRQITKFSSDENKYLICDGAVRSGKTLPMSISFIMHGMKHFNNTNFAITSKTTGACERNIITPLLTEPLSGMRLNYNRAVHVLTVTDVVKSVTNTFHIFGGNDEKSHTKVQGITLASVLFDEVALMPKSFVEQAIARTLTYENAKIWFNCNPESPAHWFYKEWIENMPPRTKHLHFLMSDNPLMSPDKIESASAMFSGIFYRRYILGEWCVAEGAIYSVYSEHKNSYYIDDVLNIYRMSVNVGLDFGGNRSQHALTATATDLTDNSIYVLRSESFAAQNVTPDELYAKTAHFIKTVESRFATRVEAVYADSAETTLINGLKSRISTPVRNSIKNPINDRIRCTTALMATNKFHMMRNYCSQLSEAFETAVWNDKKPDDQRLDNLTYNVDILDSFEYSFERYIRSLARI
jgi:PBSX family phage terminase large subunit